MRRELERNARSLARLPAVHLLPAVLAGATEARHVGELHRQRRRAVGSRETDDDTVAQGARPVGVDLAVYARGAAGGNEGGGSDAELVLVDVDDALGGSQFLQRKRKKGERGRGRTLFFTMARVVWEILLRSVPRMRGDFAMAQRPKCRRSSLVLSLPFPTICESVTSAYRARVSREKDGESHAPTCPGR